MHESEHKKKQICADLSAIACIWSNLWIASETLLMYCWYNVSSYIALILVSSTRLGKPLVHSSIIFIHLKNPNLIDENKDNISGPTPIFDNL